MLVLKVNAERPALEFTQGDGTTTRWEYDVILIKLEMERLDEKHSLRDGDKLKKPTAAYLADLCEALLALGMPVCTLDLALRMHSLVTVQFLQLSSSIRGQVYAIKEASE